MKEITRTDRLILRTWTLADTESLFEICSDPEVMLHIGTGRPYHSVSEAQHFLNWAVTYQKQNGFCRWAVVEKVSRKIIGSCGFAHLRDTEEIELGYLFARQMWGKGYATEATEACLKYGFEQLKFREVIALTGLDHTASQRVVEKMGFNCLGIKKYGGENNMVYVAVNPKNKSRANA